MGWGAVPPVGVAVVGGTAVGTGALGDAGAAVGTGCVGPQAVIRQASKTRNSVRRIVTGKPLSQSQM